MTVRSIALAAVAAASLLAVAACGDRNDGATQQTTGEIKEGVGSVVGDEELKREGQADQVVGGVKETAEDIGDAVTGK